MSTIKVDTIATRTGSGNITLSNSLASATIAGDLTVDTSSLVVDSTNNHVFIRKTSAAYQTVGHELKSDGRAFHTSSGGKALSLVRNTSNGAIMDFYNSGGTEVGSIETAASGIGIKLGGTASANLLDDYEEGTFTPGILNGWGVTSPTYSQQTGFYTKIGNVCHVSFRIGLSGGSINGNRLTVEGFPFSAGSNTSGTLWTGNGYFSTAGSGAENVFLKIVDNGVYPSFHYREANGTSEFTGTNAGAGFNLTFSGSYFTA